MRSVWFGLIAVIVVVGTVGVVISGSGPRGRKKAALNKPTAAPIATASATGDAASGQVPKVEIDNTTFDFGQVDIGDTRKHRFVVRNSGSADLTLKQIDVSCKCTTATLGAKTIGPGQTSYIDVEWAPYKADESFSQGARFETNDPKLPELRLIGEGVVASRMSIWPENVYIQEVPRNGERKFSVLLFSQDFSNVRVTKIESTLPSVATSLSDAPSNLSDIKATWMRDLTLTYRAGDEVGPFQGTIRVFYEVDGIKSNRVDSPFEFTFVGETVGELSIHGRNVIGKQLQFGSVSSAQGAKAQVYIHVRGDATNVTFTVKEAFPSFLKVRVGARQKLSETMSRFPIEIEVPEGSPQVNHANEELGMGSVELTTTHPKYPTIRFPVSLVVTP